MAEKRDTRRGDTAEHLRQLWAAIDELREAFDREHLADGFRREWGRQKAVEKAATKGGEG